MDLPELLATQAGVVTRAQALACGLSERRLRAQDPLVRLRQGVYAEARLAAAGGPARVALDVAAARLTTGVDLVAVAGTAALLHDLPLLGPRPEPPQLSERREVRPLHHGHSVLLPDEHLALTHGVPVTIPARTAVDVARRRGFRAGVVAADAALRAGTSVEDLAAVADLSRSWPGARHATRAVAFADGRSESALESLGRVLFDEQGLPSPVPQVVLGDGSGPIARVDHYWEEHRTVAEADGALKYATPADLYAEKLREDRLRDAGFEVVRYTWVEVWRCPEVVAARIRAAFLRAASRRLAA